MPTAIFNPFYKCFLAWYNELQEGSRYTTEHLLKLVTNGDRATLYELLSKCPGITKILQRDETSRRGCKRYYMKKEPAKNAAFRNEVAARQEHKFEFRTPYIVETDKVVPANKSDKVVPLEIKYENCEPKDPETVSYYADDKDPVENIVEPKTVEKAEKVVDDPVNHPSHYTYGKIECIDYIEDKDLNFNLGNAVKYITRSGHKLDAVEDLKKAVFYINREIKKLEDKAV